MKIYNIATNPQDRAALQNNPDLAMSWSEKWDMYFNPTKSIHLSINAKVNTEYRIAAADIMTRSVHKDLGITMSDDLSWNQHYEKIITKAYRMLGLLHCCLSQFQTVSAKRTLYLSLVRSQVMYCSIVWRPNLIKYITLF